MDFLKKHAAWFVAAILILFAGLSIRLAWDESTTMDEKAHIPASYSYVRYLDMRINPEHPPLVKDLSGLAMAAFLPDLNFPVPSKLWNQGDENIDPEKHPEGPAKSWGLAQWSFGDRFLFQEGNNPDQIMFVARLPIILIAVLLGYMIFRWTRELAGTLAGLFALLLFVADPNIIGHSHYVTTDIGIAAFIFFSAYFFVRFLKHPSWANVAISGLFLGLAQLAKFSAVILFPLFGLLVILYGYSRSYPGNGAIAPKSWRLTFIGSLVGKFAVSVFIAFAAIWAIYAPNVWNMPVETVQEIARSQFPNDRLGGRLAETIVVTLAETPFMKPMAQYFLGLFMVFARVSGGNTYYFLGEVSNQASALYFPAVFLMKSTLPVLAILAFALAYGFWRIMKVARRDRREQKSWGAVFAHSIEGHIAEYVMLGFVILYGYLSVSGNLNIGFRHLFPILPFLFVLGSKSLFVYLTRHRGNYITWSVTRAAIFFLSVWIILIPVFSYPSYLSYFNTAMGGPREGYRYVTDSNYDWGQDAKRLKTWIESYNRCLSNNQEQTPECRTLTDGKAFPTETPIRKIRVDYFGGSSPEYFLDDTSLSWHSHNAPEAGWYAVSANFYQESIYRKDQPNGQVNYSWFPENAWIGRAGDSIFIFFVDALPGR